MSAEFQAPRGIPDYFPPASADFRRVRDTMQRGIFARFDHDHFFNEHAGVTEMRDVFDYDAPLGPLGALAERVFLSAYLRRFLARRNHTIKQVAESDEWRRFLA